MIFSSKKLSWHDGPRLPAQFRAQMGELHQVDACPKPTNLVIGTNVSAGIHIIAWAGHFRPEPRSLLIGKAWCLGPGHLTRSLGKHWSSPWSSLFLGPKQLKSNQNAKWAGPGPCLVGLTNMQCFLQQQAAHFYGCRLLPSGRFSVHGPSKWFPNPGRTRSGNRLCGFPFGLRTKDNVLDRLQVTLAHLLIG